MLRVTIVHSEDELRQEMIARDIARPIIGLISSIDRNMPGFKKRIVEILLRPE